ncbi:MAG: alpha/beta fold hydrolase [Vicinamibacterales bacterium]
MRPVSLRHMLPRAVSVAVFLILAGASYQGAATALERRQFPHPGHMVDIGDRQLHIHCSGRGAPTVVLEAPAAGMSAAWGWVQPAVARTTRVCSYDRAGLGWSEAGDRAYDPAAVPEQLHTLLERSGERGPYVLVGHGLGAIFAKLYAARFGADVRTLILVDLPATTANGSATTTRLVRASPWLARTGILRATGLLSDNAAGLPDSSAGPMAAFLNRPDHLTRAAGELSRWDETVHLADGAALRSDLAVVPMAVRGTDRVAFLTDSSLAASVTAAIADAVERIDPSP